MQKDINKCNINSVKLCALPLAFAIPLSVGRKIKISHRFVIPRRISLSRTDFIKTAESKWTVERMLRYIYRLINYCMLSSTFSTVSVMLADFTIADRSYVTRAIRAAALNFIAARCFSVFLFHCNRNWFVLIGLFFLEELPEFVYTGAISWSEASIVSLAPVYTGPGSSSKKNGSNDAAVRIRV